jgi:hypothetical protein
LEGETEGFVKIHVKKGTDQILGATIIGSHAGDMISEITLAMHCGMELSKLVNVIRPYPTAAEAIRQCGDAYNRGASHPHRERHLPSPHGAEALVFSLAFSLPAPVSLLLVFASVVITAVMTAFAFVEFLIDCNEFFALAAHVHNHLRSYTMVIGDEA